MHHSKPTTSSCGRCMHNQYNPCPTELTSCGEGSMTCTQVHARNTELWTRQKH